MRKIRASKMILTPSVVKAAKILVTAADKFPQQYAVWTGDYNSGYVDPLEWQASEYVKNSGGKIEEKKIDSVERGYVSSFKGYPGSASKNMVIKNATKYAINLSRAYLSYYDNKRLDELNIRKEARRCDETIMRLADVWKNAKRVPIEVEACATVLNYFGRLFNEYLKRS